MPKPILWMTVALNRTKAQVVSYEISDCESADLWTSEKDARTAVVDGLRSGDRYVGLFKIEGVFDAEIQVKEV